MGVLCCPPEADEPEDPLTGETSADENGARHYRGSGSFFLVWIRCFTPTLIRPSFSGWKHQNVSTVR